MILRKPYAFFIKMFRPLHFFFALCIGLLIAYQNKIFSYLNQYLYTSELLNTQNIKNEIISSLIFVLPAILIFLSLLLFGVMYRKNKPYKFYFISIFLYLFIIIINIYISNFFSVLENAVIAVKTVKLMHDLVLINIIIESILFVIYITRGFGLNFAKFDFSSDLSKLEINDADNEEFEVDINIDFNESRRKRKERLRNFKYFYLEHKFIINIILILFLIITISMTTIYFIHKNNYNKEGINYDLNDFSMIVDGTNILNTNYEGDKITNDYLVVVKIKLKSAFASKSLFSKDFNLKISNAIIKPTTEYDKYLIDIGETYSNDILTNEYQDYIFVYEVPNKHISSEMQLEYNDKGYNFDIKLNPKKQKKYNKKIKAKKNETIQFNDSLGKIKFKIKDYEIQDYYKLNYSFCTSNNTCIDSTEYIRPRIDQNYDKTILKLDVDFVNESKLSIYNFYDLLEKFGDIYYKIEGKWNVQINGFDQIISNKTTNIYNYIGINKEIEKAENIKIVFNIRGIKYEYIIK